MQIRELWKNRYVRYIGSAALLVVLVALFFRKPPVQTETHVVQRGIFEASFEEDGVTRVKEKFTVFSPASGVMMRVQKHAGDHLNKGEVLTHVMLDYMRPVKSPVTGSILKILRESEGPVEMGAPIAEIGDTDQLEIVTEILTRDAVSLKAGNDVVISGWGGGNLPGKIRLIEPAAFTRISTLGVEEQRVKVVIDFVKPREMGEGFQVRCRLIAYRKPESVVVPAGALFREGENWALYRVIKSRAVKTRVQVSETSGGQALIAAGLQAGDEVILFPGEKIRDGVKVR